MTQAAPLPAHTAPASVGSPAGASAAAASTQSTGTNTAQSTAQSAATGALRGPDPTLRLRAEQTGRAYLSIGQVLEALREEFPDVTISKIRFLEAEGLVTPERTASGYRKFSRADVARLAYVLAAQRDHYLPLRVIKENLAAIDRGLEPAGAGSDEPTIPPALSVVPGAPDPGAFAPDPVELKLSRQELLAASGLTEDTLVPLEQYGLLAAQPGGHFDATALAIAKAAGGLAAFGVEPRHLRSFKTAADREVGLLEQLLSPLLGQRNDDARAQAQERAQQFASLAVTLHAALVKAGLGPALRR